jgi:hypothetical protein
MRKQHTLPSHVNLKIPSLNARKTTMDSLQKNGDAPRDKLAGQKMIGFSIERSLNGAKAERQAQPMVGIKTTSMPPRD